VEEPNAPDTLAALESLPSLDIAGPAPELTGRRLRGLQSVDGRYQTLTIGWAALRALDLLGLVGDFSPRDWLTGWVPVLLDGERTGGWHGALVSALRLLELRRPPGGLELNEQERTALTRPLAVAADRGGGRRARPGPDLMTPGVAARSIALGGLPQGGEIATVEFCTAARTPGSGCGLRPPRP